MSLLKHWREQRAAALEQTEGELVSFLARLHTTGQASIA